MRNAPQPLLATLVWPAGKPVIAADEKQFGPVEDPTGVMPVSLPATPDHRSGLNAEYGANEGDGFQARPAAVRIVMGREVLQ